MLQAWLDKETERHLKAPVFPLVCVSNLHAEGKAVLGNRRSWAPFKGWRRGLKSRWLPGSSPPKEPQRYLQEQQRWRRGRHVWVEAVTITQPLEGAIAALQRSYLNGSALLRHERRCEIPPFLPNVFKPSLQLLHMWKQQTPFGCCYYFCGSALAGIKYCRFQTEILCQRLRTVSDWKSVSTHIMYTSCQYVALLKTQSPIPLVW